MPKVISNFEGEYAFLSNFYPCELYYRRLTYQTTEAAFQAAKTDNFSEKLAIASASTPGKAKRLGRHVTLRPDWEDIKTGIMTEILLLKFTKGSELADMLDETGDAILVEGTSWHDQTWGICNCIDHKGVGKNLLGQILMQIRANNRNQIPSELYTETRTDWLSGGPFNT